MIHLTATTPILLATEAADFRRGLDGFVALCEHGLGQMPRDGTLYVFRNRARTMVRILAYETDSQGVGSGYWLMTKRLSRGRFRNWPSQSEPLTTLAAWQLRQVLNAVLDSSHG